MRLSANILSIDWDFFVDATANERYMLFPDNGNENISNDIQNICWAGRYIDPKLSRITIDQFAINTITKLFNNVSYNPIKVHVFDSHKHCYDLVKKVIYAGVSISRLTNIDFHHDCYSYDIEEVNCGNWLVKLMTEYPEIDYTWIKRKDSEDLSKDGDFVACSQLNISEDLSEIFNCTWDLVFICKSSVWSPPHLDGDFYNLVASAVRSRNSYVESGVMDSRYTDEMKEMTKYELAALSKYNSMFNL